MPQRTGSSNTNLQALIAGMRSSGHKEGSNFLLKIADELAKPSRGRANVNLSRIEKSCSAKEEVIIPGKLLADGILTKQVTVACFSSSEAARKKIESAGGKIISIEQLIEKNPKGTGVRIIC
ncbi:50S ribosomal protein L18e [archaeon]|nr:MAG: 50S ribosomal protein L18e [archaeon]